MSASGPIASKLGPEPALPGSDPGLRSFLQALKPAWMPAGVLAGTALLAWLVPLPESLSGLRTAGPYALLVTALAMAWRFNRGRAFVLCASLLGAFAAYHFYPSKAVYTALVVFMPLNVLLAMLLNERGARYRASYAWLLLLGLQALFIWWISGATLSLENPLVRSPPTPLVGRLVFAAAFADAVWRAWP